MDAYRYSHHSHPRPGDMHAPSDEQMFELLPDRLLQAHPEHRWTIAEVRVVT